MPLWPGQAVRWGDDGGRGGCREGFGSKERGGLHPRADVRWGSANHPLPAPRPTYLYPPSTPRLSYRGRKATDNAHPFKMCQGDGPISSYADQTILSVFKETLRDSPMPSRPASELVCSCSKRVERHRPRDTTLNGHPTRPCRMPFLAGGGVPGPSEATIRLQIKGVFVSRYASLQADGSTSADIFPTRSCAGFSRCLSCLGSSSVFLHSLSPANSFSPFLGAIASFLGLVSVGGFLFPSE